MGPLLWIAAAAAADGEPSRPFPRSLVRQEAPATGDREPVPLPGTRVEHDYERGRRMHITGNVLALAGGVVFPVAGLVTAFGAFGNGGLLVAGGSGMLLSAGALYTGAALSCVGANRATRAAGGPSIRTGTIGLIVMPASVGLAFIGLAITPELLVLPALSPGVAVVAGAIQMGQARRARGEVRVHVLPTPNGFVLAGVF